MPQQAQRQHPCTPVEERPPRNNIQPPINHIPDPMDIHLDTTDITIPREIVDIQRCTNYKSDRWYKVKFHGKPGYVWVTSDRVSEQLKNDFHSRKRFFWQISQSEEETVTDYF